MKVVSAFPEAPAILDPQYCLMSYPGHSLGGYNPSAEKQLVYSTAPVDWTIHNFNQSLNTMADLAGLNKRKNNTCMS